MARWPPVPHYILIGGHNAGRVVAFDDPAPPSIRVPYREPYGLDEFPADPSRVTFGVEEYLLVIISHAGKGQAPYPRAYVCAADLVD
jgi:hypothetical protein